jgi:hypothetical protein
MSLRRKFAALALTLLAATAAHSAEPHYGNFFTTQPIGEYAFILAEMADMGTTLDINRQRYPSGAWRMHEDNPVMGPHPSDGRVISYFAMTTGLHMAVTYQMVSHDVPAPIVAAWEIISIGVEAGYAGHNYSIGLKCKF